MTDNRSLTVLAWVGGGLMVGSSIGWGIVNHSWLSGFAMAGVWLLAGAGFVSAVLAGALLWFSVRRLVLRAWHEHLRHAELDRDPNATEVIPRYRHRR